MNRYSLHTNAPTEKNITTVFIVSVSPSGIAGAMKQETQAIRDARQHARGMTQDPTGLRYARCENPTDATLPRGAKDAKIYVKVSRSAWI